MEKELTSLVKYGYTQVEIASLYGVSKQYISLLCIKYNIKKPQKIKVVVSYIDKTKNRLRYNSTRNKNGCWIWSGSCTKTGYGRITYRGSTHYAHRVSYQVFNNVTLENSGRNTAETLCILHLCHNPSCVNPDHLQLGDMNLNICQREMRKKTLLL